ncbi:MAG: hypothetical protein C4535_18670 [Comamonadaceae bacterium]|nr:MAG: hypothetical protein C4535_18670 [Comamonadaceae bacterium]
MSLESIGKSIGSIVDERLSSPLVSGFVISWSIINWKFLVILFSDNSVSETFEMATGLYKTTRDWWGWNVALPFAVSLAYVYLLPLLSRPVHRQWRENQQQVEDDRMEAAKVERISADVSHALRVENFDFRMKVRALDAERADAVTAKELAEANAAAADRELDVEKKRAGEARRMYIDMASARDSAVIDGKRALHTILDTVRISEQLLDVLTLSPQEKSSHVSPVEWEVLKHLWRSGIVSQEDFGVWNLRALAPTLKSELPTDGKRLAVSLEQLSVDQEMELEDRGFMAAGEDRKVWRLTDKGEAVFRELKRFDALLNIRGGEGLKQRLENVRSRAAEELLDSIAVGRKVDE